MKAILYPILEKLKNPKDIKKMSTPQLKALAEEVRLFINETVVETGGHLGPNLGCVEIIIACHFVFDLIKDRFIFDVGHQCYPHKIITGRFAYFKTLRQKGGISGYPHQKESPYDVFRSGHASTAISTALGMQKGYILNNEKDRKAIALVGDGSLTGGMAFEGLNNTGILKDNLMVILNDNTMSISPTVGALSNALNKIRHQKIYSNIREEFIKIIKKIPKFGSRIEGTMKLFLEEAKTLINPNQIFTTLGFDYIGPIKGHNISEIISSLKKAKEIKGPVLLHILTEKGKGYRPDGPYGKTIQGPHALSPKKKNFIQNHQQENPPDLIVKKRKNYSACFVNKLIEIAKENEDIVAITAAMAEGTGLERFGKIFPKRYFDVGICEAHATGFAAGLASTGKKPVFAVYSTFLQRAFDQIFHEIVLQKDISVLFCIDRAGLVGDDGPSHHGMYDIAYLRLYPSFVLMAPKNGEELGKMIQFGLKLKQPVAIRYPKNSIPDKKIFNTNEEIQLGKAEIIAKGEKICLFAYGSMVEIALEAANQLEDIGIFTTVVNARFAKPIDHLMIEYLLKTHESLITLEEGTLKGGFGSGVLECANEKNLDTRKIKILGCADKLIEHASRKEQLSECSLDTKGIVLEVKKKMIHLKKKLNNFKK